jgi:hypothetical protein
MNHRADGRLLLENAGRLRLNDSGLSGNGAGKRFQENAVLVRGTGRTIKFSSHTSAVSWITDIYFITLVMCHYSASSSEARQAILPEKLELIRAGGASFPGKTNKVWKTTKQRFTRLSKAAAAQVPSLSMDKYVRAFRAALTTPKLERTQQAENGNQRRLRRACFRQQTM